MYCKKYTANKNSGVKKAKQNNLMLLSKCAVCGKKETTFIINKELSNDQFKINKIINKSLLNGDKYMPKSHLKQPEFTYSACEPFTKHRERIQTFTETSSLKYLYRNELGKTCFDHDAAYSGSKDLTQRTISDKILKNRIYEIARNCRNNGNQRALASTVYKFFDKKTGSGAIATVTV